MKIYSILLTFVAVFTVVFYEKKIEQLQNKTPIATQPIDTTKQKITTKPNYSELESLNIQLTQAQTKILELEKKLNLFQGKKIALKDEMRQNKESKKTIKALEDTVHETQEILSNTEKTLVKTEEQLNTTKESLENVVSNTDYKKLQELESIIAVFKEQNKKIIQSNIDRIETLKKASGGILVTGAILPIVGAATLLAYTAKEIDNYCQNIKDNISLEKKLFGKIISLDENAKTKYQQQCGG